LQKSLRLQLNWGTVGWQKKRLRAPLAKESGANYAIPLRNNNHVASYWGTAGLPNAVHCFGKEK
jgi:hypothetical protein